MAPSLSRDPLVDLNAIVELAFHASPAVAFGIDLNRQFDLLNTTSLQTGINCPGR